MVVRCALVLVVAAGGACGRFNFAARGDAAGDAATDASGFCAGMPGVTFCRDFDEGQGLSDWQGSNSFFGSMQVDPSEARSAPASLRVATTAVASGQSADISVEQDSLGVATHVTASFALQVDVAGTLDAALFDISMDDGSEIHDLEIVDRAPPQLGYVEDVNIPNGSVSTIQSFATAELSVGTWHQVALDYQSGPSARVTLSYDGATVLDTPPMYTTGGNTSAIIGVTYLAGPATAWQIHVDNVVVQVQ